MVSLLLFGFPLVVHDGAAVDISRRKVTGLLAYLAVTGARHGRDTLPNCCSPSRTRATLAPP